MLLYGSVCCSTLLSDSIERGLANEIGEREVLLFHRPEWGSVVLQACQRDRSDEETSRLVLRNFEENRAQNAPSLINFCAQCVDLVAFIGSGRTGTWEHPETVLHHDAIEKYQASERVVMVVGHAACREVSQTASFLRCERGVVFVVGKQEESSKAQSRCEDGAVVVVVVDNKREALRSNK